MADLLLSGLIKVVLVKVADPLFRRIGEMWGINDQRERLHNMLLEIQAVIPDAEGQANFNTAVKSWLEKLESAAYEADDLLDEFCYQKLRQDAVRRGHKVGNVSDFFSLKSPLLRYKMSGKLKNVVQRVDCMVAQMGRFGFVHGQRVHVANRIRTDSLVVESNVVGRDEDKEKVVQLLLKGCESDDLMVVPIVGMGGLGKTTLAQLVYNDPRVKEYFNLLLWVCVSEEDNIGQIVKSIIELVKGECNLPTNNMELLQRNLRKEISGKRYLLVLDDVWNENVDNWKRLRALLDCGDSRSAIIVTTRSSRVATIMNMIESYNLSCLGEDDSWSLFHERAFSMGVKECQQLVEIGRKMVQNCQGLPLAIKTLGSLMSYKPEVREWLDVLKESRIWEQRHARDEVLPVLRLSYDHLPSYMKQCFAFCAVYPKDYKMDKEKLIQLWMANGFVPSDGSSSLEMEGNSIFNELVWRSFFQEISQVGPSHIKQWTYKFAYQWGEHCFETKCKMHDLMHDLAKSIMGSKCLSTSELPTQVNQPMINVHYISVETTPVDINKTIDCFPFIRTLIYSYNDKGASFVKNIGFLKSNSLRILELYVTPVEKTVFTAGKIKHLRYLEIFIDKCTSLPEELSNLYLLQTLRLPNCRQLEKLPEGMRYMSSLRHLYITEPGPKLRSMPKGLGQLNSLQILTAYIVGTDAGNGINELNNLNNLHGQLHLYNLGEIQHVLDAKQANLIAKENLDDLALCWGMPKNFEDIPESNAPKVMHCDPFQVLDALKPCTNLKVLQIKEYRGDRFPVWMTECQMLENLIELYIIECRECTRMPPVQKLPFLQNIKLKHLDNLRNLCNSVITSPEDGENARVAFPSLKKMVLSEMPELCSWCEGEDGNKSFMIFPELKALKVINCPKLTAMPIVPLLKSMSVKGNKDLSHFATVLTTLHDLSLESNGGNESLSFQPWESLNKLKLRKYDNIVLVGAKEGEVSITQTKCRSLEVSNIPLNTSLWFSKCFTYLEKLHIMGCDNLIYWHEEVFGSLKCLRFLRVCDCPNFLGSQLESPVVRSITEVLLPILQELDIMRCPNLVDVPKCSTSLRFMRISCTMKLQYLPEWLGSMISLKDLYILSCESLNSLPLSIGGLTSLETLCINECPNLTYLPEGMEGLKALETLWIKGSPKIRVLPEGLLQHLKNLNDFRIKGCPHLKRHFQMYGKYRHLTSEIPITKFGEQRRSDILKNLALSLPSCKITSFPARS